MVITMATVGNHGYYHGNCDAGDGGREPLLAQLKVNKNIVLVNVARTPLQYNYPPSTTAL